MTDWFNTSTLFPVIIQATTYLYNEPTAWAGVHANSIVDGVQVFPNPAHGKITVALPDNARGKNNKLALVNSLGQTVREVLVQETLSEISLAELPVGMYIYHLQNNSGIVAQGKISVE